MRMTEREGYASESALELASTLSAAAKKDSEVLLKMSEKADSLKGASRKVNLSLVTNLEKAIKMAKKKRYIVSPEFRELYEYHVNGLCVFEYLIKDYSPPEEEGYKRYSREFLRISDDFHKIADDLKNKLSDKKTRPTSFSERP